MPARERRPVLTRVLVLAVLMAGLVLGIACTHEKTLPPELAGVYGRIHESREDFEQGIEMILAGEDVAGENQLAAATTRLIVATRECSQTPGCEIDLFHDAMEQLVAEQRSLRIATAEQGVETAPLADEADDAELLAESLALAGADPPTLEDSLLSGADLASLIPMNAKVEAALNDWLTWHRPALVEAYEHYKFLRPGMLPSYREAELPEALLFAMMAKESGGKVHAYSRAGAAGPLQFMGRTGMRYGLGSVDGFDMRLDPVASARANARYMKDLLRVFDGDLELAVAAYNVGVTRLRRLAQRNPGAGFWDDEIYYALPWETRNYVPKVLAAAWLFLHAEEYGMQFDPEAMTVTTIQLEQPASLGELSVCLGQTLKPEGWFRTLRNLNPRLSPGERAPTGATLVMPTALVRIYSARCVGDTPLMRLARRLHDADYPEEPELMQYTVRRGDTLAAIAARHRSSLRELARLNGIAGPRYVIRVGQKLRVPSRG